MHTHTFMSNIKVIMLQIFTLPRLIRSS